MTRNLDLLNRTLHVRGRSSGLPPFVLHVSSLSAYEELREIIRMDGCKDSLIRALCNLTWKQLHERVYSQFRHEVRTPKGVHKTPRADNNPQRRRSDRMPDQPVARSTNPQTSNPNSHLGQGVPMTAQEVMNRDRSKDPQIRGLSPSQLAKEQKIRSAEFNRERRRGEAEGAAIIAELKKAKRDNSVPKPAPMNLDAWAEESGLGSAAVPAPQLPIEEPAVKVYVPTWLTFLVVFNSLCSIVAIVLATTNR